MADDKCQVFKQRREETDHSIKGHLKKVADFKNYFLLNKEVCQHFLLIELKFFVIQMNKYKIIFISANPEVLLIAASTNFVLLTFSLVHLFLCHEH